MHDDMDADGFAGPAETVDQVEGKVGGEEWWECWLASVAAAIDGGFGSGGGGGTGLRLDVTEGDGAEGDIHWGTVGRHGGSRRVKWRSCQVMKGRLIVWSERWKFLMLTTVVDSCLEIKTVGSRGGSSADGHDSFSQAPAGCEEVLYRGSGEKLSFFDMEIMLHIMLHNHIRKAKNRLSDEEEY